MTFGERLARKRKENNFTQEQLAEVLGVSRQSISKWESDLTYPETEKLLRLCQLFWPSACSPWGSSLSTALRQGSSRQEP